jgi:hypothetical protein
MAHHPDNRRDEYGNIDLLTASIWSNIETGQEPIHTPLKGYYKEDTFFVVRGNRRMEALRIIYETHGLDVEALAQIESKGTSSEDRLIEQYTTNNLHKEYTPLEQAALVKVLQEQHEKTGAWIAKRWGVTEAWISRLNLLNKAPESLLVAIKNGLVNTNLVMDAVKEKRADQLADQLKGKDSSDIENVTSLDGRHITEPTAASIKDGNKIQEVNSWREFKKEAVFLDQNKIDDDKRETFAFLLRVLNNEVTGDDIKKYFYKDRKNKLNEY